MRHLTWIKPLWLAAGLAAACGGADGDESPGPESGATEVPGGLPHDKAFAREMSAGGKAGW